MYIWEKFSQSKWLKGIAHKKTWQQDSLWLTQDRFILLVCVFLASCLHPQKFTPQSCQGNTNRLSLASGENVSLVNSASLLEVLLEGTRFCPLNIIFKTEFLQSIIFSYSFSALWNYKILWKLNTDFVV